jgi:DNA-binding transcriptional MerR regulator
MALFREGEISVGELAKDFGLTTATINFYVQEGLLPAPRRLNRTRAAYSDRHRRVLKLVKRMQTVGLPLATIKRMLGQMGTHDEGLARLEGMGLLTALPPPRRDPRQAPLEPFAPIDRDALVARAEVSRELVARLESWGLLRPRQPGAYDRRDLWLVLSVKALVDDGIALERLAVLRRLVPVLRGAARLMEELLGRYLERLRRRDVRFRDVVEPLINVQTYLLHRLHDELNPAWRDEILS